MDTKLSEQIQATIDALELTQTQAVLLTLRTGRGPAGSQATHAPTSYVTA